MARKQEVDIQRSVRGEPLEVYLGNLPGVQAVVKARAKEIEATAEEIMQPHHFTDATRIEMARNRKRGLFAAGYIISLIDHAGGMEVPIEFGRKPQFIETDPQVATKGKWTTSSKVPRGPGGNYGWVKRFTPVGMPYGGMDALKILQRAVLAVRARHRRDFR